MSRLGWLVLLCLVVGLACKPDLGERESLITTTRVLAIRVDPPEARPSESVRLSLLVATKDGPLEAPAATYAYCASAKLLTENGAASRACLTDEGARVIASGPTAEAPIPADACATFGPDVTSAELRPRDPDITGGFYQPVRVSLAAEGGLSYAFGFARVRCNSSANADVAAELGRRYVANTNPEIVSVEARLESTGAPVDLGAIGQGQRVVLRASWSSTSQEAYVSYDLDARTVAERRESLRVSWFATGGVFDADRTGRDANEVETFTDNAWTAPTAATPVHLYVVLRDTRGGVAFTTRSLTVR